MNEHKPGLGYCILHDPDMEKDREAFDSALAKHRKMQRERREEVKREEGDDYEPRWELRDDFRWIVFPDGIKLNGTKFPREGADFEDAIFGDYAYLREMKFAGGVSFRRARFGHRVDLRRIEYSGSASYWNAEFGDRADFLETEFPENTSFQGATLGYRPIFDSVTFGKGLKFSDARLGNEPQFKGTTIGDNADFHETEFGDEMRFIATVGDEANFNDVIVGAGSQWAMGSFGDSTRFVGAQFKGFAYFREVTFRDGADFSRAVFEDKLEMVKVEFGETAIFKATEFLGRVTMRGENHDRLFSRRCAPSTQAKFIDAAFSEPDKVAFRYADLRRAQFIHADIRKIEFTSVTWPRIKGGYGVYDEEVYDKSDEAYPYGALARLYRRLKQNYEDQRDYGRGGDFHYREKEMMLENPRTPEPTRVVLRLYRAFSGYGERLRAGWFLVGLIISYGFGGLLLGLQENANGTWETLSCAPSQLCDSLMHSLAHSLQVALLRKPTSTQPATPEGEIVQVAVMILGPLFLGLFALAIRQRVRR